MIEVGWRIDEREGDVKGIMIIDGPRFGSDCRQDFVFRRKVFDIASIII